MTEPFRLTARTPAGKIRYAVEQLNGVHAQDSAGQTKLIAVRMVLDQIADELDSAPEFPLPIRPDGSHYYLSSYCAHGDHDVCRLRCKTCDAACECGCGHPAPETGDDSALTREELQDLVDEQGTDLYKARDLLDFVREMCDQRDAAGTPITTADVRNWLGYTGCGGVLRLPDWAVAALIAMSADMGTPLRAPVTQPERSTWLLQIQVAAPTPQDAERWSGGIADLVRAEFGDSMRLDITAGPVRP